MSRDLEETPGSIPMRSAKTSPSASARRLRPRMRLMASLARPACPTGPMWKYEAKMALEDARHVELRRVAAHQSDTATLPDLLAGAGDRRFQQMQAAVSTRAARAAIRSGSHVLAQSTILSEFGPNAGRSSRSTTVSTWSVSNTATKMDVQCWRSRAREPAKAPPIFSNAAASPDRRRTQHGVSGAEETLRQGAAHQAEPDDFDLPCDVHASLALAGGGRTGPFAGCEPLTTRKDAARLCGLLPSVPAASPKRHLPRPDPFRRRCRTHNRFRPAHG